VKEIVDGLKANHSKFVDPDFGPNDEDEFGAKSLYGDSKPEPAGSKYPSPDTLRWERPQYDDNKFSVESEEIKKSEDEIEGGEENEEEEDDDDDDEFGFGGGGGKGDQLEIFCKHGRLFIDGSSSGDVIQGQLGDCWFLSALAVLGADDALLEKCFWRRDEFREYGMYVLRFFKDTSIFFVIIDDRLPVKAKDGKLIFAGGKDPNELWVPLIEKAYAKLHGCYKALIGGYTHYGLADMTGYSPRLIVFREGYLGFSQSYSADQLWELLTKYRYWNSLMGCSIQSNPKEKHKVEADAGQGLHMGHAYSLLALGEINTDEGPKRLVKLRNPWGRGEWEGSFSDESPEREKNKAEIARVFDAHSREVERSQINLSDGTFFMPFDEWMKIFTSVFVAINFPATIFDPVTKQNEFHWSGKRSSGKWSGEQGGNRDMGTWITNPKFRLRIDSSPGQENPTYVEVFIGLYIKDSRLTRGFDYFKDPLYATPLTFDVVTSAELSKASTAPSKIVSDAVRFLPINHGSNDCAQPPYNFGATQLELFLKPNVDYYIVPSLYKRNQAGAFFLTVFAHTLSFQLDGSTGGGGAGAEMNKPMESKVGPLTLSIAQFNEKKEFLRERIVQETLRLGLSIAQLNAALFNGEQKELSRSQFKRRMMDVGYMLTDVPHDDFVVLDEGTGNINIDLFIKFVDTGMNFGKTGGGVGENPIVAPDKPVDDLLFKAIDLSGELAVLVGSARGLRDASAWFTKKENPPTESASASANGIRAIVAQMQKDCGEVETILCMTRSKQH
jgi:hypothetical protein